MRHDQAINIKHHWVETNDSGISAMPWNKSGNILKLGQEIKEQKEKSSHEHF